jgi:hypothetical protein
MSCVYKKKNGDACGSKAMKQSEYCFFHNPDTDADRKVAQSNGGKGNAVVVKQPLPPVEIRDVVDVVKLLEDTVNRVRAGEIDVRVGNCIGVLSGHLIKALEVSSVVNRVEIIERAILEKRTRIS